MWKPLGKSHDPYSYKKTKTRGESDRYTQQKRRPLMLFFKEYTFEKMAHDKYTFCVEIDKYGSPKKGTLQKAHLAKKLRS